MVSYHYIVSYHIIPYIVSNHIIPYRIESYHTIPHYMTSHFVHHYITYCKLLYDITLLRMSPNNGYLISLHFWTHEWLNRPEGIWIFYEQVQSGETTCDYEVTSQWSRVTLLVILLSDNTDENHVHSQQVTSASHLNEQTNFETKMEKSSQKDKNSYIKNNFISSVTGRWR
jgi:hypothetical protein